MMAKKNLNEVKCEELFPTSFPLGTYVQCDFGARQYDDECWGYSQTQSLHSGGQRRGYIDSTALIPGQESLP